MVFLLLQYSKPLFIILSLLSFSESFPLIPSLLSLNCTLPSQNATVDNKSNQILVDNLTLQVTNTRFITSTIKFGPDLLVGFMQCRSNLTPSVCTLCAQVAKQTIFTQCPNATAITAWFDGCYLHYYSRHNSSIYATPYLDTTSYWSCSNRTIFMNRVDDQFEAAFETLLLILRADMVKVVSQLRFSTGEVQYGDRSSQVLYGLAECVHNVSHEDCEVCLEKGTEKLLACCGGKDGGTVVAGHCIVRFQTYKFFSRVRSDGGSDASNGSSGAVNIVWVGNENGGETGFQWKVAAIWGVGAGCLVVVVFCAWLLRRSIINIAKVGMYGDEKPDDAGPGK